MTTTCEPTRLTVGFCLRRASIACDDARWSEHDGRLDAARRGYLRAERWLDRASKLRGTFADDGPAKLDARLEIERRLGLAN